MSLDWQDLARRAGRQVVQVLTPALVAMAAGSASGFTAAGLAMMAAGAVAVTFVKSAAGIEALPTDPWWLQALERASAAAGGALAGYTAAGPWLDLVNLPWPTIGWSVAGAVGLSLAAMITNPPVVTRVTITPLPKPDAGAVAAWLPWLGLAVLTGILAALAVLGLTRGVTDSRQLHAGGCHTIGPGAAIRAATCLRVRGPYGHNWG